MKKTLSSPLVAAANNIVSLGSRSNSLTRFQRDFNSFNRFLEVEKRSLEKLKLPDKKKIKALASLNIASNFGRPGNLLGSLFSGALDLAGFVGNMFPGRGKLGKPQRPSNAKPPKPTVRGPRLKMGGIRAVGVGNALFAGLDFATGLAEGESVGKSAAGTGGALAGSLLGGAIGQALIPIPGLGFVVGSMAGSFLGGYAADRVYEGGSSLKQKLDERLKGQEAKQKALTGGSGSFADAITKFDQAVGKFEKISFNVADSEYIGTGTQSDLSSAGADQISSGTEDGATTGDYPGLDNAERVAPFVTGSISDYPGAQFGASRDGGRVHAGQDIKDQKAGDPVLAAMAGTVVEVGTGARWQKGGGTSQTIGIKHKDGTRTRYVHIMADVSMGAEVKTGQKIGKISPADVWSSADFPHLHFEYYNSSGKLLDPRPFLRTAPKTPAVAPIKTGTKVGAPDVGAMKFGANDIESAPVVTVGDSIAAGMLQKSGGEGYGQKSASTDQVLGFMKNQNMKGKLLRLSSGISNDAGGIRNVKKQIELAQQMGAKGVQLMGTSVDRTDLSKLNPQLEALAKEFPGFVQFTGGFNAADKIHPDYAKQLKKLESLRSGGGMGGPSVDASQIEAKTLQQLQKLQGYPSYNQPGGGASVIMPIMMGGGGGGQQRPVYIPVGGGGGGGTVIMPGPTEGQVVNSLMKTMLLTNLSAT
jgi:murein DD-endopeptidase MepM/ murein hydrolase activator NlpD